jgi:hypothetical protein
MTAIDPVSEEPRKRFSRLRKIAPFLLLGPISGPLAAGVVFNFREGRPVLGTLYAIALVEIAIVLPYVVTTLGLRVL